jgi:Glycosyl hydrolase family 26
MGTVWRYRRAQSVLVMLAFLVTASPAFGRAASGGTLTTVDRTFAVATPGAPDDLAPVDELAGLLGRTPDSVVFYAAWAARSDFPTAAAQAIASRGAVPEVTWEPWDPAQGVEQPAYALDRIVAGDHDAYVTRWARQIAGYAKPVVLRFAHEMNGTWYPWAEQVNGNGPGDYVAAWRHVRSVFRKAGAGNVRWRWAPNVPYPGSAPLASLYPGDASVDEVGLDGYNWSTLQPGTAWQSFDEVFEPGLKELASISTRPVYVAEVGCPEVGGDKAAWIAGMWSTLDRHPEVRGLTWFNFDKETDWRIQSSPESQLAFRTGVLAFR